MTLKMGKVNQGGRENYVVLTTKHHGGVALFDTKHTELNVINKTPMGGDLIALYCNTLRQKEIHVGLYSTNAKWSETGNFEHA